MTERKSLYELRTKTLATRMRELSNLEGFDVEVTNSDGELVSLRTLGFMRYDFDLPAYGRTTVTEWKDSRFRRYYPQLHCRVLYANGQEASGFTMLQLVRDSYCE
jgi:hypothetical protein